jgi:hypothetical protein
MYSITGTPVIEKGNAIREREKREKVNCGHYIEMQQGCSLRSDLTDKKEAQKNIIALLVCIHYDKNSQKVENVDFSE